MNLTVKGVEDVESCHEYRARLLWPKERIVWNNLTEADLKLDQKTIRLGGRRS